MHSSSSLLLWALFSVLIFFSHSVSSSFAPANNVTLLGDASFRNGAISLTQEQGCYISSSSSCGVGRAIYAYPIRFLDPTTNSTASFSCRFSFLITPSPSSLFGDGLTFLITSNASAACNTAGYMGLLDCTTTDQESFIAVEFDTSLEPFLGDLNDNHVGLDINTVVSFASVDAGSIGIDLKSGRRMRAWIEYRDAEKMIRVWLSYSRFRPPNPLLATGVDLSNRFKEFMHVGFSASNGRGSALHLVEKWRFKTFGFLPSTTPIETGQGEDGCFRCSVEDSDVDSGSTHHHKRKRTKIKVLGLAVAGAILLGAISAGGNLLYRARKRKKIDKRSKETRQMDVIQLNEAPTELSLAEIKSATNDFNQNRIVGEGGTGKVYEGLLASGKQVAVKRFNRSNHVNSGSDPFNTELGAMLGGLRHKNLVQLQGWCNEENELILIYEFLPQGSLCKILNKNSNSPIHLTFDQRMNIILGVASALTYLHEECVRQIIHRDVKTCNIMLDAEFNPKLGDFGLAEYYEHNEVGRQASIPAGTTGYFAPEYVHSGLATVKTDVYSFGVVVLEVATGRLPVENDGTLLGDWVWGMWAKGKLMKAVDSRLIGRFNEEKMQRLFLVGLSCVHPTSVERPTVREAARMIRGEVPLPVLPKKKPVVRIQSELPEGSEEILREHGDGDGGTPEGSEEILREHGDGDGGTSGTPSWSTPDTHFS